MRVPTMSEGTRSGVNCSAGERAGHGAGERLDGQRLGHAGHALEQAVPAGQQADHHALDQALLTDDDPLDLEHHPFERRRRRPPGSTAAARWVGHSPGSPSHAAARAGHRLESDSRYGTERYVACDAINCPQPTPIQRRGVRRAAAGPPRPPTCRGATRGCTTRARVKHWLACDEHADQLADFLARRGFLLGRDAVGGSE